MRCCLAPECAPAFRSLSCQKQTASGCAAGRSDHGSSRIRRARHARSRIAIAGVGQFRELRSPEFAQGSLPTPIRKDSLRTGPSQAGRVSAWAKVRAMEAARLGPKNRWNKDGPQQMSSWHRLDVGAHPFLWALVGRHHGCGERHAMRRHEVAMQRLAWAAFVVIAV